MGDIVKWFEKGIDCDDQGCTHVDVRYVLQSGGDLNIFEYLEYRVAACDRYRCRKIYGGVNIPEVSTSRYSDSLSRTTLISSEAGKKAGANITDQGWVSRGLEALCFQSLCDTREPKNYWQGTECNSNRNGRLVNRSVSSIAASKFCTRVRR
jgi:hypothetical protein